MIGSFPEAVALREFFRRKRCQPQQIVGPVFDHVYSKIVSRVDAKVCPVPIAESQTLEFDQAVERRVFDAPNFRNIHQPEDHFGVKDLSVGCEHLPQLERENLRIAAACLSIDRRPLPCGLSMELGGLKQDWRAAKPGDPIHLPAVEFDGGTGLALDIDASYKWHIVSQ